MQQKRHAARLECRCSPVASRRPAPIRFRYEETPMLRLSATSRLACALVGALAFTSADAALRLSDQFDGSFYNKSQSGRGALIDAVKGADGKFTYALALYTYNAQGNPEWLLVPAALGEFQYKAA